MLNALTLCTSSCQWAARCFHAGSSVYHGWPVFS